MDAPATPPLYSAADFAARALRGAGPHNASEFGDHRMNPGIAPLLSKDRLRDAAVLVPVIDHGSEASVLLTQRSAALRSHSGQVAFPGGKIDPTDPSPEAAALREAYEEVGLAGDRVEIVGRMPDYLTATGYRIAPVLSVVKPDFALSLNPDEVAGAFEVPLSFLMEAQNHRRGSRVWMDRERFFYEMPYGGHHIWGVTAGIIRVIYERLYA